MSGPPAGNRHLTLGFLDPHTDRDGRVDAAREELRRRLPELRRLPGCPQGSDEDILAMSYPPYYTACPNPFITDWLTGLDRPGDDDRKDPGPFAADVVEGKGNAFYKAHSYPTKVPHPAIMRFILHYTRPGDVVLDGFAGSGMTGVAAQACGNPEPKVRRAIEADLGADNIEWGARRGDPRRTWTVGHVYQRRRESAYRRRCVRWGLAGAAQPLRERVRLDVPDHGYRGEREVHSRPASTTSCGQRCSRARTVAARSSSTTPPSTRPRAACAMSSAARPAEPPLGRALSNAVRSGSGPSPVTSWSESSSVR